MLVLPDTAQTETRPARLYKKAARVMGGRPARMNKVQTMYSFKNAGIQSDLPLMLMVRVMEQSSANFFR